MDRAGLYAEDGALEHVHLCNCAIVHSYCRSRSGPAITGLSWDDEGKTELCPADNRTNNNGGSEPAKDNVGNEKVRWGEGERGVIRPEHPCPQSLKTISADTRQLNPDEIFPPVLCLFPDKPGHLRCKPGNQ